MKKINYFEKIENNTLNSSGNVMISTKSNLNDEKYLIESVKENIQILAKIRYDKILSKIYRNRKIDMRERVDNTLKYPFSAIGALFIKYNNDFWLGTGNLISENLILTAAHNIFVNNEFEGTEVLFYPAISDNRIFVNSKSTIKKILIPETYKDNNYSGDDYALIVLDQPIGKYFGYFGLGLLSNLDLTNSNQKFYLYGYPGDKIRDKPGNYELWGMKLENVQIHQDGEKDGTISYTMDSYSGMSGAGIWFTDIDRDGNLKSYVIGIHVMHDQCKREGIGVHLNKKRFDKILEWCDSL